MNSKIGKFVVTGSKGFIGRNLMEALRRCPNVEVKGFDIDSSFENLATALRESDAVFHLAGVNRPDRIEEYEEGNHVFTKKLCTILEESNKTPLIVFSSSIQVGLENPYGKSKLRAENELKDWSKRTGAGVSMFRLKNVFGKWCRPNYNSVVATFCHNMTRGLPITISDPVKKIELVYIDDVISAFINCLKNPPQGYEFRNVSPFFIITLGELARKVEMFRDSRESIFLPDFSDSFTKRLYATYISYLEKRDFAYRLDTREDARGELAEFLKQANFGQIFISRTKPGITRGNHFHHTKVEKFFVVEGNAIIRFRMIDRDEILQYQVSGKDFKVVDIPPGYTHSIENIGHDDLITLFWADEVFNPKDPDTYHLDVIENDKKGTTS